jgi:predicted PurR-regulated permease PerM
MMRRRAHSSSAVQHRRPARRREPTGSTGIRDAPLWGKVLWGAGFTLIGLALLWVLRPVFAVLAASAGLAYILDPMIDWMEGRGMSREGGIGVLFLGLFSGFLLTLLLLVPSFVVQGEEFINGLAPFFRSLPEQLAPALAFISEKTGYSVPLDLSDLQSTLPGLVADNAPKIQEWATTITRGLFTQGIGLLGAIVNLTLMPIFIYYLLRDWDRLVSAMAGLIPLQHRARVARVAVEVDGRLGAFVRGQITVCLSLAVLYSAGLLLVGIDLAIPVGVLSGLLFIVPYLGTAVGIVLGVLLALMKFGFSTKVLAVLAVFVVVQGIEGYLLTPRIVGDKVGLHPLVVMIALIVGGSLLGIWGMLLAIPITAVLSVLGAEYLQDYFSSAVFKGADAIPPAPLDTEGAE